MTSLPWAVRDASYLWPCPPPNPALGTWTYRSFANNPDIEKDFNDLEFGRGELTIDKLAPGIFEGRLSFGDTYQFRLNGTADLASFPCTVRFEGVGDTRDSKRQIYDYMGFFVPTWSNGVEQRAALVGTTVRTVAHNGGRARAGVVGSFIALKRDEEA
jgi:hypothetical protein